MTGDQITLVLSGIAIGIDLTLILQMVGQHLDDRRDQRALRQHLDALAALEARTAELAEDGGR